MTIQETLAEGKRLLQSPSPSSFIDTPALDAALLIAAILRTGRAELIIRGNDPMSDKNREEFLSLIERRRKGECVAYLLGRREFRGLEFTVNPQVLVPRPDTETLVEAVLEYIDTNLSHRGTEAQKEEEGEGRKITLLDLCTGSGAIAISLKNERPFLCVTASDISHEALETARLNAAHLIGGHLLGEQVLDERFSDGEPDTVCFIHSDLFENIPGCFDIIVSNPPYIPTGELSALAPEVRREPQLALDGGEDGLVLIRKIISQAQEHLSPGGVILLEADSGQMPDIKNLLATNGFSNTRIHKDLAGRDRVISAYTATFSLR